jgi:hypothetical protein
MSILSNSLQLNLRNIRLFEAVEKCFRSIQEPEIGALMICGVDFTAEDLVRPQSKTRLIATSAGENAFLISQSLNKAQFSFETSHLIEKLEPQ